MFGGAPSFAATQGTSPDTAGAKKPRTEEKQTCLPTTIRGMEAAVASRMDDGGDLKFYGSEPGMLVIVALVETITRQATSLEMTLNDSTGRMKARYFVSDPSPGELDSIKPGTYISAFGNVRTAPALHFAVTGLHPVESADEVSYHMIEAAHAMLRLQNPNHRREPSTPAPSEAKRAMQVDSTGPAPKAGEFQTPVKEQPAQAANPYAQQQPPATANPYTQQAPAFSTPAAATTAPVVVKATHVQAVQPAGPLKGAELRAALLSYLKEESAGPEGVSVDAMNAKFASVTASEVRETLQILTDDGEVYSTIDDNHFAVV